MTLRLLKPLLAAAVLGGLAAAAFLTREAWLPWVRHGEPAEAESHESPGESAAPSTKVIVSDQAQKNLGLTAKRLKATSAWRTVTVPGMVVDRLGVSDRAVVAPAAGVVSAIHRVPGDAVRPGDALFTLKLLSESLHATQTDLFKAAQDIKLAQAQRERLAAAGGAVPEARTVEVDAQVRRLEVAVRAYRQELLNRGLPPAAIDAVAEGRFAAELTVAAPAASEVQELKVELGQQALAGQTLALLANHRSLSIEGRAFADETALLERSLSERWPVEVDFQDAAAGWPASGQTFFIRHVANSIDPASRTFAFTLPLENQSRAAGARLLWRFRPGQRVRLRVRAEEVKDVFLLPPDAVGRDGPESFVFAQNADTFERKAVRVVFQDRDRAAIANDGALPTYVKDGEAWTIPAVAQTAAAQLSRMARAGASGVPKGYHVHADGSLHRNEDEGK